LLSLSSLLLSCCHRCKYRRRRHRHCHHHHHHYQLKYITYSSIK
jgi:hypothetical protein